MASLKGKVALVTGSSSGIGEAVARAFAAEGASVVVNSSKSVEEGQRVAGDLADAIYLRADVSDETQARALVEGAVERYGRLDVLVNNAGTTVLIPHPDLEAVTTEVWRKILDTNVLGTWYTTVAAVPHLQASGEGSIVNVTSLAGVRPTGSSIPYAVSKAGLNHMTKLLAGVLGPQVRVNAVAPGLIDTPWTAEWEAVRQNVRQRAPLGRSGLPEDVAEVVLMLVRSPYVTGEVVVVDGGLQLR